MRIVKSRNYLLRNERPIRSASYPKYSRGDPAARGAFLECVNYADPRNFA